MPLSYGWRSKKARRRSARIMWITKILIYYTYMKEGTRRELRALVTFVGTILGAGLFGIPFVLSRAGAMIGVFWFVLLSVVMTLLHLYFARITLAVRARHRFPGFAGVIFGEHAKQVAAALGIFGGWLGILAYIILGGTFLYMLVGPLLGGSEFMYQIIFAAFGAAVVWRGFNAYLLGEIIMAVFLVVVILIFVGVGIPYVEVENFLPMNAMAALLPYGVIVFALSGLAVVPELEDILGKEAPARLSRVVVGGTIAAALLTAIFGFVVFGVTGGATTSEAILGFAGPVGRWVVTLGALFGFLAIITSYLPFLMNQAETFRFDYKLHRGISWILAFGVPFLLFLFGARSFIHVIGLSGGAFGGLTAVMLIAMYLKIKRGKLSVWGKLAPIAVGLIFFLGAIAELLVFFGKDSAVVSFFVGS